jgi:hypothetical protein
MLNTVAVGETADMLTGCKRWLKLKLLVMPAGPHIHFFKERVVLVPGNRDHSTSMRRHWNHFVTSNA